MAVPFGAKMSLWVPLAAADPLAGSANATAAITLGAATLAGTGKVLIKGTLGATFETATLASTGIVANQVFTGTLATTLGPVTLAAFSGAITTTGTLGVTLGALTATSTGRVLITGTAAGTFLPLSLAGSGSVGNQVFIGTLGATLGPATLAATARTPISGTLGVTLGQLSLSASSGAITTVGTLGATLGALTATSVGTVPARGTLGATLAPTMLVAGRGTVSNRVFAGTLAATLNPATLTSAGAVTTPARSGTLGVTLAPLTLQARGYFFRSDVWPHDWCPAPGAGRTNELAVETVAYGDGYRHRITRGLNPVRPRLDYAFPFVGLQRLQQMDAFLKTNGVVGFSFSPPDAAEPIWVACDEWSASIVDRSGAKELVGTLQAAFVERFNR